MKFDPVFSRELSRWETKRAGSGVFRILFAAWAGEMMGGTWGGVKRDDVGSVGDYVIQTPFRGSGFSNASGPDGRGKLPNLVVLYRSECVRVPV